MVHQLLGVLDRDMKEFEHTKKLKQSGNYFEFIEEFQPTYKTLGYPSDDMLSLDDVLSLGQLASGGVFELWHDYQFVQNEVMQVCDHPNFWGHPNTVYRAEHSPILAGTTTGKVVFDGNDVYTFVVNASGNFHFKRIGENELVYDVYEASLNLATGELTLGWTGAEPTIIISYEYNLEVQP
jgi:hypothetical protein